MPTKFKTVHNAFPCCNIGSSIKHEYHDDDAVLEKTCRRCGRQYRITFENVEPLKGCGVFRKLHWEKLTGPGGRPLDEPEDDDDDE